MELKAKVALLLLAQFVNIGLSIPLAYSCFADAFKAQFNMTQTNANIVELSLTSTVMFVLPAGIVFERYGIMTVVTLHLLFSTVGWTSVWLCVVLKQHLIRYPYVVMAATLVSGNARTYLCIFLFAYLPQLVDTRYRSFVLFSMDLGFEVGVFIMSQIYDNLFINGHYDDAENQSLEGFMLFVVVLEWLGGVLLIGLAVAVQKNQSGDQSKGEGHSTECPALYRSDETTSDESTILRQREPTQPVTEKIGLTSTFESPAPEHQASTSTPITETQEKSERFPLSYLLILASSAIPISIVYVQLLNITYMARSFHLTHLDYLCVTLIPVCTFFGKILVFIGIAKERNYFYIYESCTIAVNVLILTVQLLLFFYGRQSIVFMTWLIVSGIVLGIQNVMLILLINDYFLSDYVNKFSFSWSFVCVFMTIIQVGFGRMYDSEIPPGGGQYCYGAHCLTNTFIIYISFFSIALLSSLGLLFLKYRMRSSDK